MRQKFTVHSKNLTWNTIHDWDIDDDPFVLDHHRCRDTFLRWCTHPQRNQQVYIPRFSIYFYAYSSSVMTCETHGQQFTDAAGYLRALNLAQDAVGYVSVLDFDRAAPNDFSDLMRPAESSSKY